MEQDNKIKATLEDLKTFETLLAETATDGDALDKLNELASERDWFTTVFKENGKEGVKDLDGSILVPAMFDTVCYTYDRKFFDASKPVVVLQDGKFGIVKADGTGEMLVPCEHEHIHDFYGMYIIKDNGKAGLFSCGEMVVPQIIDKIYEPCADLIVFEADGKTGLYDTASEIYVEPVYDSMELAPEETIKVMLRGKEGFLDAEDGHFVPVEEAGPDPEDSDLYMYCAID